MAFSDRLKQNKIDSADKPKNTAFEEEKHAATARGEPWVAVIDTKVNPDDIKHGFFELDWNEQFIELLLDDGYVGESQEELVEKWFTNIVSGLLEDNDYTVESGNVVGFLRKDEE